VASYETPRLTAGLLHHRRRPIEYFRTPGETVGPRSTESPAPTTSFCRICICTSGLSGLFCSELARSPMWSLQNPPIGRQEISIRNSSIHPVYGLDLWRSQAVLDGFGCMRPSMGGLSTERGLEVNFHGCPWIWTLNFLSDRYFLDIHA
jgi:hypothetical protein